jgi:type IV pilus assembly protein PilA
MTTTILRPQLRQALLRQLQKDSKRKRNILQQGFTLVELMIVIVIVGILSAVALPNFLSQTSKAKATECNSKAGAILSQVAAEHLISGNADTFLTSEVDNNNANRINCDFTAVAGVAGTAAGTTVYGVTVNGFGTIAGKYGAKACVNADTGKRELQYKTGASNITSASAADPDCG